MKTEHQFYDREDGLAHCKICNGGEGSLPTECPGIKMSADEDTAVYAGTLDYFHGKWWVVRDSPPKAP